MKRTAALLLIFFTLSVPAAAGELFQKGLQFYQDGKNLLAISSFKKALEQGDNSYQVYFYLGNAYMLNGDMEKAMDSYSQALIIQSPADFQAGVYFNMASIYKKRKDYTNALSYFTRSLALDAGMVLNYRERGLTYIRMMDKDRAVADLKSYVDLAPRQERIATNAREMKNIDNIRKFLALAEDPAFVIPDDKARPNTLIDIEGVLDNVKPADKGKVSDQDLEGIEK